MRRVPYFRVNDETPAAANEKFMLFRPTFVFLYQQIFWPPPKDPGPTENTPQPRGGSGNVSGDDGERRIANGRVVVGNDGGNGAGRSVGRSVDGRSPSSYCCSYGPRVHWAVAIM